MRSFAEIYDIAADRKGGPAELEKLFAKPLSVQHLRDVPDDRLLAEMARCLFQAGFSWKVINAKWDGFETAFHRFDPARVAFYHDEDVDRLLLDTAIVRNGAKIAAVIDNARFVLDLSEKHGSAAEYFASWPGEDYVGLLNALAKKGARLGGVTGQRMLRNVGRDGFVLSPDVTTRLIAEGVIAKSPTSKRDQAAVQTAFNTWADQSGRCLTHISQVLAFSV